MTEAVPGMSGELGSFGAFAVLWTSMMGAMMLPGAAPAVWRRANAHRRPGDIVLFVASYMAVWTSIGMVVFLLYRPLEATGVGIVVVAAGFYELTPFKAHFRQRCREDSGNGIELGWCCIGSSLGLMLVLVAVGMMSLGWMVALAAIVVAQKALPAMKVLDLPVAAALIGLGVLVMVDPSSVPGLMVPM